MRGRWFWGKRGSIPSLIPYREWYSDRPAGVLPEPAAYLWVPDIPYHERYSDRAADTLPDIEDLESGDPYHEWHKAAHAPFDPHHEWYLTSMEKAFQVP